jgi:alkanesulfonate monooxygenase SsuD/methylene tetrahydromethanopterin reductase-like flavin-dependent oxidoreductase (luciferase family)
MMLDGGLEFGFVTPPVGEPGTSDRQMYRDLMDDAAFGLSLGYTTVWVLEHHFSDYFPTPDPIALLAHIAGRHPEAGLGTCVIIAPWHNPLRLAGSIAQLRMLTERPLHLGMGRGTAKYEYDRFGVDMEEARTRFKETMDIVRKALTGEMFTYAGKLLSVDRPTRVRPRTGMAGINFYGAIGASPESAEIMASLGLPPICTSIGNLQAQIETLRQWARKARENGTRTRVTLPIMINCIVEDSDREAVEEAKLYVPRYMQAQVDHYETDADHFRHIETYKAWSKAFAGMKARCNPENIPPWTEWQLVGSPETVRRKLQAYIDGGFNMFLIHTSTPGVPPAPRRRWLERFAREVVPHFRTTAAPSLEAV